MRRVPCSPVPEISTRKQHHFQPNGDRFNAWDVHRLIELSAGLPAFDVEIDSISELDRAYWSNPGDGPSTHPQIATNLRFVEAVDTQNPIIRGHDGRVIDGMHRVAKALLQGRETVTAVQFAADRARLRERDPRDLAYG